MKTLVQISVMITLCCTSVLVISLILLVVKVKVLVLPHLDRAIVSIQAIELNTTRTEAEMSGLLNTTRHIALDEQKAQSQQLADVHQLSIKAGKLLDDADVSVQRFGYAAQSLSSIAPVVADSVRSTSEDAHNMLQAATIDISAPAIQKTLDEALKSSQNIAAATQNMADTTQDIKDYVHRETTPVRGFWNGVKALINITWSIRGAAGL